MTIYSDPEFKEHTVERVVPDAQGGWHVHHDGCLVLFVTNKHCKVPPQVGDRMTCWGKGLGSAVRGIKIGDFVYRYQTKAQWQAENAYQRAKAIQDKERKFAKSRASRDARTEALPEPLAKRMRYFQESEAWRRDLEEYELAICEEAVKAAAWIRGPGGGDGESVKRLYTDQKLAAEAGISADHSGNSFSMVLVLGRALVEEPDAVWKVHGSMCPLVGCSEAMCYAGRAKGGE